MKTIEYLQNIIDNFDGTFEEFYEQYSGDKLTDEYMTLSFNEIDVKIYRDWSIDEEYTIYDNKGNKSKRRR